MGWHLDGAATAVVGTHTHVQTADEQLLPQGTAYITDVGMTGPHDGIIGVERDPVIDRFLTGLPARFESAKGMPRLHACRDRGRRVDRPRDRDHAAAPVEDRAGADGLRASMTSLFDLPFEDEPHEPRPDAPAAPEAAPAQPHREVLTVTELAAAIRERLEQAFFEVWVEGEISNCKRW